MAATSNHGYPNANSNYNANSQNCDRNLIIFFVVLAAFVVAASIIALALLYHPDFPEFSVSGFEVSNFSLTSNSLTSNFNVSVAVRNPNKRSSIRYDETHAAVLYSTGDAGDAVLYRDDFVIAKAPVFPFTQRPRDVTDLKVKSGTVGLHVDDEDMSGTGSAGTESDELGQPEQEQSVQEVVMDAGQQQEGVGTASEEDTEVRAALEGSRSSAGRERD